MSSTPYSTRPARHIDLDAIRRLPADTARRWGIVHQNTKRKRGNRWAFDFESKHAAIEFHRDGKFTYHKDNHNGDVIDLVVLYQNGGTFDRSKRAFMQAAQWIAERENLWASWSSFQKRAAQIARPSKPSNGRSWHEELIHDVTTGHRRATASIGAARELLDPLGIAWDRWSLAMQAASGQTGALCWVPAAPWLGARVLRKESGWPGGWTKELMRASWTEPEAGLIHFIDLDGDKGSGTLPPIALVLRLRRQLATEGYPVTATVFSSWRDGVEDRAKCHLYFKAKTKATTPERWNARAKLVAEAAVGIIKGWRDVPDEDRAAMHLDRSADAFTRLVRMPGFNKLGSTYAASVYEADANASVDFTRLIETRPQTVDAGKTWWTFNKQLTKTTTKTVKGEEVEVNNVLADQVWPVATVEDVATGAHGVRVRYHDRAGRTHYAVVEAASWVATDAATARAKELAAAGLQIRPSQGRATVEALGHWAARPGQFGELEHTVSTPGWHMGEDPPVYVAGNVVHGARWIYTGPKMRSARTGSLGGWQEGWREHCTTPALRLAVGVALAGAMIAPLRRDSFMVHLAGPSSSGKSKAGLVAAGVWGSPESVLSYNSTAKRLAQALGRYTGACAVLDEIKHIEPWNLGQFVHTLAEGVERGRLTRQATEREQMRWALTAVSTGEVTISERLGLDSQGGHAVRALDLRIERGESTRDATHADAIDRWVGQHHGHIGLAFAAMLQQQDAAWWDQVPDVIAKTVTQLRAQNVVHGAEDERIARQLALVGLALAQAATWSLLDLGDDHEATAYELVAWAMGRIIMERGIATSPEARAWQALQQLYLSNPARFPTPDAYAGSKGGDVVGIRQDHKREPGDPAYKLIAGSEETEHTLVWTCEGMLKATPEIQRAACGPRQLLAWAEAQGLALRAGRKRIAGVMQRWLVLDLDRDPPA